MIEHRTVVLDNWAAQYLLVISLYIAYNIKLLTS